MSIYGYKCIPAAEATGACAGASVVGAADGAVSTVLAAAGAAGSTVKSAAAKKPKGERNVKADICAQETTCARGLYACGLLLFQSACMGKQ